MFKRHWTASSKLMNYSKLSVEHNWEDLCVHLKINKHALVGGPNFNPNFVGAAL
jgi:hypothetical protein